MPSGGVIGNSGGKKGRSGRKPKSVEEHEIKLLAKGWPENDRLAFIQKLSEMARKGHLEAGRFLWDRVFGKPVERQKIDSTVQQVGLTLDEWKQQRDKARDQVNETIAVFEEQE